jgi:hypothetical protein
MVRELGQAATHSVAVLLYARAATMTAIADRNAADPDAPTVLSPSQAIIKNSIIRNGPGRLSARSLPWKAQISKKATIYSRVTFGHSAEFPHPAIPCTDSLRGWGKLVVGTL